MMGGSNTKGLWARQYEQRPRAVYHDWGVEYEGPLRELIQDHMPRDRSVLELGCGNAPLAEAMAADGYTDITAIDFVGKVVADGESHSRWPHAVRYQKMDARKLELADQSFAGVIDRGTLDAIELESILDVRQACSEVARVLEPGGVFLVVSGKLPVPGMEVNFADPAFGWSVEPHRLEAPDGDGFCYVYIMTKERGGV